MSSTRRATPCWRASTPAAAVPLANACDHRRGDLGRIGRDSARGHPVIAGEHHEPDQFGRSRWAGALAGGEPGREVLDSAEGADRLGKCGKTSPGSELCGPAGSNDHGTDTDTRGCQGSTRGGDEVLGRPRLVTGRRDPVVQEGKQASSPIRRRRSCGILTLGSRRARSSASAQGSLLRGATVISSLSWHNASWSSPTAERRAASDPVFGDQGPLVPDAEIAPVLGRVQRWTAAPEAACRQTAALLGAVEPVIVEELAGPELGSWTGRTLGEVAAEDPEGLQAWLSDPGPHLTAASRLSPRRAGSAWPVIGTTGRTARASWWSHRALRGFSRSTRWAARPSSSFRLDVAAGSRFRLSRHGGSWRLLLG